MINQSQQGVGHLIQFRLTAQKNGLQLSPPMLPAPGQPLPAPSSHPVEVKLGQSLLLEPGPLLAWLIKRVALLKLMAQQHHPFRLWERTIEK